MQKIMLYAVGFFVALGAALGVFLYVSLIPYFFQIGIAAAVLVGILLFCAGMLLLTSTAAAMSRVWRNRRLVRVGELVAYRDSDGSWTHLSAMHEQAKVQLPAYTVKQLPAGKPDIDADTVRELYEGHGISEESLAKAAGITRYQVRKKLGK